jgi:NAD(P)H-flavin reductase
MGETPKNPLLPRRAKIREVRQETHDVKTYVLSLEEAEGFMPSPGQFNMVGRPGVGEAPISISAIPANGGAGLLEHTVRAVGRVTEYMAKLAPGDEIFLRGPYGRGWPAEPGGDVLIVAGGLGLAPLRPFVRKAAEGRSGEVSLLYGARDPSNVLFKDELEQWARQLPVMLTVDEVPEGGRWQHGVGLITGLFDKVRIEPRRSSAFICGPEIMMRFAARQLVLMGLPPSRIFVSLERRMRCGVAQCGHCQLGSLFVCKDGPVVAYDEVKGLPDMLL